MFYGWRIVAGSFLSQAFVIGFFTYAVSLLTQPVQESFGVSVEMVMYSLTLGTFISLFSTYTAILSNMTPYATELGHEEQAASGLIMVVAISGL